MLNFLIIFIIVGAVLSVFPRGAKFLFVAPFIGTCFGGFVWAAAAMCFSSLVTWPVFACSLATGVLLAEVVAISEELT